MIGELRDEQLCYVTTTGRKTGRAHEIEIWFVVHDGSLFLMSGGGVRSDWVRNILADRRVRVRIGASHFEAVAEVAPDDVDDQVVRQTMAAKYQSWEPGEPLSRWAAAALVVRVRPTGSLGAG